VLHAYRAGNDRGAATLDDGTWLKVGMLLEHASLLASAERATHIELAASVVRDVIGEAAWSTGHPTDPEASDHQCLAGPLRVYCEDIEDAGAVELADAILVAFLAADTRCTSLDRARIESVRARLAWKQGNTDAASERYRRVMALARKLRSDELRVRAWTGEAIVARLRGDYPEARVKGRRAVALAEQAGLRRLASVAHQAMMVADAVAGEYDSAIAHAWKAFLCADGHEAMAAAALGNVGQVFLDAGHPATAMSAFVAVVQRQPSPRILLPAFGGIAVAAARLGNTATLEHARQQIVQHLNVGSMPYDAATVMLDLACAYAISGDRDTAATFRQNAEVIATTFRFHEIEFRAQALTKDVVHLVPEEHVLAPALETVAGELRVLAGA
jgi:tetratricopeptide (TPR) repeat protein